MTVDIFKKAKKTILVTEAAKRSLTEIDLATAKVIRADNVAYVMRHIVESASLAQSSQKLIYPDSKLWARRYAAAAAIPIKGAPWNPAVEYDAALALWNGYDDDAAARMSEFLAGTGRTVLIVGRQKGALAGLNGARAEVAATYDDQIKLSSSAIIIAPGGIWPRKTNASRPFSRHGSRPMNQLERSA